MHAIGEHSDDPQPSSVAITPGYDLPGGWIEEVRRTTGNTTAKVGGVMTEQVQGLGYSIDSFLGRAPNASDSDSAVDSVHESMRNLTIYDASGEGDLGTEHVSQPDLLTMNTTAFKVSGDQNTDSVDLPSAAHETQPTLIDTITEKLSYLPLSGFLAPLLGERRAGQSGPDEAADRPAQEEVVPPQPGKESMDTFGMRTDDTPGFIDMPGGLLGNLTNSAIWQKGYTPTEQPNLGTSAPGSIDGAAGIAGEVKGGKSEDEHNSQPVEASWEAAPFMTVGSDQAGVLNSTDMFPGTAPQRPSHDPHSTVLDNHASEYNHPAPGEQSEEQSVAHPAGGRMTRDPPKLGTAGILGLGASAAIAWKKNENGVHSSPSGHPTSLPSVPMSPPTHGEVLDNQPKTSAPGDPIVPPLSQKYAEADGLKRAEETSTNRLIGEPPKQTPDGVPIVVALSDKHADTFARLNTSTQLPKGGNQSQPSAVDLLGPPPKQTLPGQPIVQPTSEKYAHVFDNVGDDSHVPKTDPQMSPSNPGISSFNVSEDQSKKNRELAVAAGLATPADEHEPLGRTVVSNRQKGIDEASACASFGNHPCVLSEPDRHEGAAAGNVESEAHEPSIIDAPGRLQRLRTAVEAGTVSAAAVGSPAQDMKTGNNRIGQKNMHPSNAGGGPVTGSVDGAAIMPSSDPSPSAPLPRVEEVDTPRDEHGNNLNYGTETILAFPDQSDPVNDELAATSAHVQEEPVQARTSAVPYGTGQHTHRETGLEKEVQKEGAFRDPFEATLGKKAAAIVVAGSAAAAADAETRDNQSGGVIYGSNNIARFNDDEGVQNWPPSQPLPEGGSPNMTTTFTGSGATDGPDDTGGQQTARQPQKISPQDVVADLPKPDQNKLTVNDGHHRQSSLLRKRPSKKLQEDEKQRRRSLPAETAAASNIPEKRRRGSVDEKERRHRKLHKKRRSVEDGGLLATESRHTGGELGHRNELASTTNQVPTTDSAQSNLPSETQDSLVTSAHGMSPPASNAQRTGDHVRPSSLAAYGTDWRTAGVPDDEGDGDKCARTSGSTPNSSSSSTSPRKRKPSLLRRMQGEAKVLSGMLAMDYGKIEQGRLMKEGYVCSKHQPGPEQ